METNNDTKKLQMATQISGSLDPTRDGFEETFFALCATCAQLAILTNLDADVVTRMLNKELGLE